MTFPISITRERFLADHYFGVPSAAPRVRIEINAAEFKPTPEQIQKFLNTHGAVISARLKWGK